MIKALRALAAVLTLLGARSLGAGQPPRAPLYWNPYEYNFNHDSFIPEDIWSKNIDWVEKNLKPYGYDMVCIDGWGDDSPFTLNGYRMKHAQQWKNDYAWWSKRLQSKGMRLGIYNNPLWVNRAAANAGCLIKGTKIPLKDIINYSEPGLFTWVQVRNKGAEEYVKGYVQYYADMGVKFLRVDFLSWYEDGMDKEKAVARKNRPHADYVTALRWMREACDKNGMTLSLVMPHLKDEGKVEREYGHMIRVGDDCDRGGWSRFSDSNRGIRFRWWSQFSNPFDGFVYWSRYSGRGKVMLDGDFIRLSTYEDDEERRSVVSLNLLAGGPVSVADEFDSIGKNLWAYQNRELLAMNADGFVGQPFSHDPQDDKSQLWKGQMQNGDWVVGLFNRETSPKARSVDFAADLGLPSGAKVRDLWAHKDLGLQKGLQATLAPHACKVYRVSLK